MAITRLDIEAFLQLAEKHPVLDVRSPGEYAHAHIPGAHSLPLFTDEERKTVGTAYKQQSQQKAIKLGLGFYSSKLVSMVEEVETLLQLKHTDPSFRRDEHIVLVHCWRGGMRSAGVAWLLDLYGFKVYTLVGGYKAFRKWVLLQFEKKYWLHIVGGFTGSGKTEVLQCLQQKGQHVIDLEKLAGHKGSAFGNLGLPRQASQEMFENKLASALYKTAALQSSEEMQRPIWLEDESQRIGEVNIPVAFYKQMRDKPLYFLNIPFEERLDYIVEHYGKFEKEKLVNTIIRIRKRLGGLETKTAIAHLIEDDIKESFRVLLTYYDKFYLKSLQNRADLSAVLNKVELNTVNAEANATSILATAVKTMITFL